MRQSAAENNVELRPAKLDLTSQTSVDTAVQRVVDEAGKIDVILHNAGHMVYGPAEAFTEQLAELYKRTTQGLRLSTT